MPTGAAAICARKPRPDSTGLTFSTAHLLQGTGRSSIYPEICITFECRGEGHYHLPLLLSDNSYTTYRGS